MGRPCAPRRPPRRRARPGPRSASRSGPRPGRPWWGSGGRRCRRRPRPSRAMSSICASLPCSAKQLAGGLEHRVAVAAARRRAATRAPGALRASSMGVVRDVCVVVVTQTESEFRIVYNRNRNSASDYATNFGHECTGGYSDDDRARSTARSAGWALALLCAWPSSWSSSTPPSSTSRCRRSARAPASPRRTSPGSSTPTSSPSAASCCSAGAWRTCSAAAASSWRA